MTAVGNLNGKPLPSKNFLRPCRKTNREGDPSRRQQKFRYVLISTVLPFLSLCYHTRGAASFCKINWLDSGFAETAIVPCIRLWQACSIRTALSIWFLWVVAFLAPRRFCYDEGILDTVIAHAMIDLETLSKFVKCWFQAFGFLSRSILISILDSHLTSSEINRGAELVA